MRDLGVYRGICPPTWSADNGLWVIERGSSEWKELDASTGKPTGRTDKSTAERGKECDQVPGRHGLAQRDFQLRMTESRMTEIRLAASN